MSGLLGTWVNGESAVALPLPDRGLDFGDGLFETLLVRDGVALFEELHLERLQRGLKVLSFPSCEDSVNQCLHSVLAECAPHPWVALRLTVTRGAAPRGYAPPQDSMPRVVISAAALNKDRSLLESPAHLEWADLRLSTQPALAGLKHLNRLEQVLAAQEAASLGCDEVVLCDQQENVISVAAGNLFIRREHKLITPRLDGCGVAGTRRRLILERLAPELGLEVVEDHLARQDLEGAQELFYCNALIGLRPVASLGDIRWDDHSAGEAIHRQMWGQVS